MSDRTGKGWTVAVLIGGLVMLVAAIVVIAVIAVSSNNAGNKHRAQISKLQKDIADLQTEVKVLSSSSTSGSTQPNQTSVQTQPTTPAQNDTQQEAIAQYMLSKGDNIANYDFRNVKTSQSDPSWEIYDYQRFEGMGHWVFLVHEVNRQWSVIAATTNVPMNAQAHGGPSDLTYP